MTSRSPQALGCLVPTGWVWLPELPPYQAMASISPGRSESFPDRAAYSHSASEGRRHDQLVDRIPAFRCCSVSRLQKSTASSQLTCSTGRFRPQKLLGSPP